MSKAKTETETETTVTEPEFRIGRHINVSHGFVTAPWYAEQIGCRVFQIFLGSPQQVLTKARAEADLKLFSKELAKRDLKMIVHSSYTINLCHPATALKFKKSLKSLVQDLKATAILGPRCLGAIIHMGKNITELKQTDEQAIDNYVSGLHTALAQSPAPTRIVLETGAAVGTEVGSDLDSLAEIYWKLDATDRERIGFCIDTCHIWATGYDISTRTGVKLFFTEFEDKIGIEKIVCIHFNDSRDKVHSCVDHHADLGYGEIGTKGLRAFARRAKRHNIPIITETPLDAVNPATNRDITITEELATIRSWLE